MKLDKRDALDSLDRLIAHCEEREGKSSVKFFSRLQRLRALIDSGSDGTFRRSQLDRSVFSGVAESSLRSLRSEFRKELATASEETGLRLTLEVESGRGNEGDEIVCYLEGDSLSDARLLAEARDVESLSREGIAASGTGSYIPMRAWPDEPLVFVSFAVAETALVDRFMRELLANLRPQCQHRVKLWRFDEVTAESGIVPGEENEVEIRRAMDKCQFGILLISPTYIGRPFIERVELPHFTGPDAKAPAVPVALADWSPGSDKDPRFDAKNVYSLKGKPYNHLRDPKQKSDFVKGLAKRIEAFIDRHKAAAGMVESTVETSVPLPKPAVESPQRFPEGPLSKEEIEKLKEWHDLEGRPENHLGRMLQKPSELGDSISRDGAVDLMTRVTEWAASGPETPAYLALLGETGAGKTMTCLEFTRRLLADGKADPLVIYLDLRRANEDGLIKRNERPLLAEIIDAIRRRTGSGQHASTDELLQAVRGRGAILIWDGLDEVLVHLGHEAGQAFFKQLLEALPPRLAILPGAGRLVFACRTQYFRDLNHEADLFTGGQKEGIPIDGSAKKEKGKATRACFEVLRVLPFSEEQIRGYLAANVPGIDVDRAFDVIESVHNLRELAGRPYLLSLMRESLADFDTELASGRRVRSVDLYERLINRWLEREKTREVIGRAHKRRLMQRLAAHFWREGIRSIPVDDLDAWLEKLVVTDPLFAAAMGQQWRSGSEARDTLCEHLRAATFLGRWDRGAFRFSHTSLLEYFLACHLCEALEEGHLEEWALPRPSIETIDFLVERAAVRREANPAAAKRMEATLFRLLGECQTGRSVNALGFYVRSHAAGEFLPVPERIDARGLDLTGFLFAGDAHHPLLLPRADFTGATLIRAVFHHVHAPDAHFAGADLCSAEFLGCDVERAEFSGSRMEGVRLRACRLSGSRVAGANLQGLRVEIPDWDTATARHWHESWVASHPVDATPALRPWIDEDSPANFSRVPPNHPRISQFQSRWSLGHSNWVASVAVSPDGTRILSGSRDETARLWDASSGACLRVFEGHSNSVASVAFSPDGTRILSGSSDNTVRLWDASSGACLRVFKGHSNSVTRVAFSPDGTRILSGSNDITVRVWDASSGACLRVFKGHSNLVASVAFSPDGTRILSGSYDNTVRLWDASSGACQRVFKGHSNLVASVAFSPDGTRILSGSSDNTVRVWDASSGACLRVFEGHSNSVASVAFSPDGTRILSGSYDNTARLWDASSGACLRVFEGHSDRVASVAFSPDGTRILSGSSDYTVRLWDASSGACLRVFEGHFNRVSSVVFSPDGTRILSVPFGETFSHWDANSGARLRVFEGHSDMVTSVAFSQDATRIVSGSSDQNACLWEANSGTCLRVFEGHSYAVSFVALSQDASRILSGSWDKNFLIWDANSGERLKPTISDRLLLEKTQAEQVANASHISNQGTLRYSLSDGTERDIALLPDDGYCVLEKKPGGPWRIARAKGEYWRYVNYASDTRPDGSPGRTLYSADLFGPVPEG